MYVLYVQFEGNILQMAPNYFNSSITRRIQQKVRVRVDVLALCTLFSFKVSRYSLDSVMNIIYKCMYYMCILKKVFFELHKSFLIHKLWEEYNNTIFLYWYLGTSFMYLLMYVVCIFNTWIYFFHLHLILISYF